MSRLTEFVNKTEMTSFTSLVKLVAYLGVVLSLAVADVILLLRGGNAAEVVGLQLALALLGTTVGQSVVSAASNYGVRTTSREYMAGKARAAGAAPPTVQVDAAESVNVAAAPVGAPGVGGAPGAPRAPAAAEPDAYTDDERGE